MKQNKQALVLTVVLAVVITVVGAWPCVAQCRPIDDEVLRFRNEAAKAGFVVQAGLPVITNLNDLYCDYKMWAPLYPNPNAPYFSAVLPHVPGQADPVASKGSFRLREDEAIVVIGVTPPPMAYFSLNFHMLRGSLDSNTGPPILWIPVADPVSSLTLEKIGPTPFNQPFAVVATGHRKTQALVHQMLRAAGLGALTNDQIIAPSLFQLGLGAKSDEFIFAMRTAIPSNSDEFNRYMSALREDVRIFRVRPKSDSEGNQVTPMFARDPLPVPRMRVSGTGTGELDLNPTLQQLRRRIIAKYPDFKATDIRVDHWFEEPYPGLQRDLYSFLPDQDGVDGATTDATYLATANFTLPDGSFLVAYGAHHRATGKATYSSVAVYADDNLGVGLVTVHSPELQGSAQDYINDLPNADMFYAWTFTRANSGFGHITQLPAGTFCKESSRPVDLSRLRVGYRAYAEPATQTHPAKSEILFDRLLLFAPK